MRRGDIHLADLPPPLGSRPVLLVTRTAAIAVRTAVTVAPVTRTIRDIPSEVPLGLSHGLKQRSVANCDSLQTIPKDALHPGDPWDGSVPTSSPRSTARCGSRSASAPDGLSCPP